MIPVLFKPAEDELFTAWIEKIAEINHMSLNDFYFTYFRYTQQRKIEQWLYPRNLEEGCKNKRGNRLFPSLFDILRRHTDVYARLTGMSESYAAKLFEEILHNDERYLDLGNQNFKCKWNLCPECEKEDMARYGRRIIHVPHQIQGVSYCWKHGCALTKLDGEPVRKVIDIVVENRIAQYAYDLYQKPVLSYFEQTKQVIDQNFQKNALSLTKAIKNAYDAGFLNDVEFRSIKKRYNRSSGTEMLYLMRWLPFLYATPEDFRKEITPASVSEKSTEDFFSLGRQDLLVRYQCKACRHIFYMAPKAAAIRVPCPKCGCGRTEEEQRQLYFSNYQNGEYILVDQGRKKRHIPCGKETILPYGFWFQDSVFCSDCAAQSKEKWQQGLDKKNKDEFEVLDVSERQIVADQTKLRRITLRHRICGYEFEIWGHRKYLTGVGRVLCPKCNPSKYLKAGTYKKCGNGMGVTVLGYDRPRYVRVRFDNGLESVITDSTFRGTLRNIPEAHIGEKHINKKGESYTIVEYVNKNKMTAQFEDGTKVPCDAQKIRFGRVYKEVK